MEDMRSFKMAEKFSWYPAVFRVSMIRLPMSILCSLIQWTATQYIMAAEKRDVINSWHRLPCLAIFSLSIVHGLDCSSHVFPGSRTPEERYTVCDIGSWKFHKKPGSGKMKAVSSGMYNFLYVSCYALSPESILHTHQRWEWCIFMYTS